MMEKYANYTGILAILFTLAAVILTLLAVDFNSGTFLTLGGLVMALAFTPLFFINHKQKFDAYRVPCYITSTIVSGLLILGAILSGNSMAFGEPNFYSGSFLALCFMIAILLFKPPAIHRVIVIILTILMIGGFLAKHLMEGTL